MKAERVRRRWAIGSGALLAFLALPASALGATASVSGATFTFSAAGGETNDVVVETDGGVFRVIDNNAPVNAGANCLQRSVHRVNCANAGVSLVRVVAGDQDDEVLTLIGSTDAELSGGRGGDTLTSSDGDDTLSAGRGGHGFTSESLIAGAGDDILQGPTDDVNALLDGGADDDQLLGGPGPDSLFGNLGADLIQGGGSTDFASWGGAAGVTVTVGAGANDGEPGEGDDVRGDVEFFFGTNFGDVLIGNAGSQVFFGSGGQDTLEGAGGDDSLIGGDAADSLEGGDGTDQLSGGANPDDFSGGPGIDTVDYGDHTGAVTVRIDNVANDGGGPMGGGTEGDNVRTDVEQLVGGPANDTLIGSAQDNEVVGMAGDDDVRGEGGDDDVFGDSEFQFGTPGDDDLSGGNGDDTLFGGGDADVFRGGAGFDFVDYSPHAGIIDLDVTINNAVGDGAAGEGDNVTDTVEGVIGSGGNDTLTGSSAANTLFGGPGIDDLSGANGPDLLDGDGPGFPSGSFGDVLDGGNGIDTVSYRTHGFSGVTVDIGGGANDGIGGATEGDDVQNTVENLIGSDGFDLLTGNAAANTITGRGGNDTLTGGAGPDALAGNAGFDTHEGQGGKDEINSRGDGPFDVDNCGTESDVAIVDASDTVNADCEDVIP